MGLAMGVQPFTPARLYAGGHRGAFFDFSDASALTLVSGAISQAADLSGNGNHASQATGAKRPASTGGYAEFSAAAHQRLGVATLDVSASDALTVCMAIRRTNNTGAIIAELGNTDANAGSHFLSQAVASPNHFEYMGGGTGRPFKSVFNGSAYSAVPTDYVLTHALDISADSNVYRVNGTQTVTADDLGTGNFGSLPFYIGGRGAGTDFSWAGRIYALLVIGRLLTTAERDQLEAWMADKAGVTL